MVRPARSASRQRRRGGPGAAARRHPSARSRRPDGRGGRPARAAFQLDRDPDANVSGRSRERFRTRALALPERREERPGQPRRRRDLAQCARAAEQVAQVRLDAPARVAHELPQCRRRALDDGVGVGEVVGRQALPVTGRLPAARGEVDRGRVLERRQHALGEGPAGEHRIPHALAGDRVLEVPSVSCERPAGPGGGAEEGRNVAGGAKLGARRRAGDAR